MLRKITQVSCCLSYGSIEIFTIKKVLVVLGPFFIVKSTRLVLNLGMIHDMIRLIAANENTLLNNFRVIISSCVLTFT